MAEAIAGEIDQRAGAEIVDKRHPARLRDRSKLACSYFRGETLDAIVRRMHLEDEASLRSDCVRIVLRMRAVGGADLHKLGAGAGHDIRHAEGAADLDQLAARDNRLAAKRERVEDEKHGRRIVIDDGRVFGSGQFANERAQMVVALAALALLDIEFKGDRLAHGRVDSLDRFLRQKRAAEIGVQNGSGEVEDGAKGGSFPGFELRQNIEGHIEGFRLYRSRKAGRTCGGERVTNAIRRGLSSETLDRRSGERCPQHLIDRWNVAQAGCGQIVHRALNSQAGTD